MDEGGVWLIDTSVWSRTTKPTVMAELEALTDRAGIATCGIVDLEVLFMSRNAAEHRSHRRKRGLLIQLAMPEDIWTRAIDVQALLAAMGHHRAAKLPDLLIAATAEHHQVGVLHYDKDFDLIAEVTNQPAAWIVERGSAD